VDVSATDDNFRVDHLVGLHSSKSLSGNLLELSSVASNRCAKVGYLFGLFIGHTSHHKDDEGVGLSLAVTLGDEGVLHKVQLTFGKLIKD
jgi:hypothetical protein